MKHMMHPVSVARKVMEDPEISFIVGDGALAFALARGFEKATNEELLVGSELED